MIFAKAYSLHEEKQINIKYFALENENCLGRLQVMYKNVEQVTKAEFMEHCAGSTGVSHTPLILEFEEAIAFHSSV